ncbi:MAG: hypothetical protein AAB116_22485 [Candidatus Poribacteria bacterium]
MKANSQAISYDPSKDKLTLRFHPLKGKPTKEFGRYKIWWDEEGSIDGIDIASFAEELEEFKKKQWAIRLGGSWEGIEITDEDIKENREDLLKKIEEKW